MRPHTLTMKAFGPFAKETRVDFDAMGNNIYLISGDTGAGKTTIFDGIIYALYGTASGGARSTLGTEAFHSDYSKDGKHRDEMRVELEFSNANRRFTVSRRMYWGKRGDAAKPTRESTLSENGNTLVHSGGKETNDEVTAKIIEILGLDADQFRRIIMLAQGEFQKFLTAKSDERGVILGKLYDNRRHRDFQMRLKSAGDLLREQDKTLVEAAKAQIKIFVIPDEIEEDVRCALAVDHPALLPALSQIIEQMNEELEELNQSVLEKNEALEGLKQQKTRGETQNGLLDDLKKKRAELEAEEKDRGRIDAIRRQTELAEAAEKVIPAEKTMSRAEDDRNKILERIQKLEEERTRLAVRLGKLEIRRSEVKAENDPKIEELRKQQAALEEKLHFYDDLARSIRIYNSRKREYSAALDAVQKAQTDLAGKQKRQSELEESLQKLASAGPSEVENAKHICDEAETRKKDLEEIRKGIPAAKRLISEEKTLAGTLAGAQQEENLAEEEYHRLYTAFRQGQAGILAQDLREKLKEEPQVTCPVCGAVHTIADEPLFAPWHEDIPDGDEVDSAYDRLDAARKARKTAEGKHSDKVTELKLAVNSLLEKSGKLISVTEWKELAAGKALTTAIRDCETALFEAKTRYGRAVADKKEKEKAEAEKAQVLQSLEAVTRLLEEASQKETGLKAETASAGTSVANWKEQLKGYPDKKEEAENRVSSIKENIRTLQDQIKAAEDAYSECSSQQSQNRGNLESAGNEKADREKTGEEAKAAFAAALSKYSFADQAAYHAALSPEGRLLNQDAIASWISRKQKETDTYDKKCTELKSAIRQLTKSTEGMEYTDISAIVAKIEEISGTLKTMNESGSRLDANVRRNRAVLKELQKLQKQRAKLSKVSAKLTPMTEAANGNYAFSRYVLTGFFHRIVEQANIHLETMTDGEYCLIPTESGDARGSIGLGLKVMNTITNLERDTGSLSGGQLFEASLSLALGLSDIVQMESASRIQIDSMFIDEGFGSLDGGRLDKAIEVLQHLSAGKRQIGIISHVARLDECLPKKIHVIAGDRGSTVRIETDA